MIVTVASFKGGVGKTTTAIHLAAYLNQLAPTLLLDGDPNSTALAWNRSGGLPFPVEHIRKGIRLARNYTHTVIDTEARPGPEDFKALAEEGDLLVIPAVPRNTDTHGLTLTVQALRELPGVAYRVLLTRVPAREPEAGLIRSQLTELGVPMFVTEIPELKAFDKAMGQGVLVQDVADPRARRAWEAYEAAGKEITNAS
jgi:chromosome partitioning protein